jgi:hypothetical protein
MRTIDEMMTDATACTTKEEARELVKNEVAGIMHQRPNLLEEEARAIVLGNIGYMTGYCDRAEAGRLLGLFETRHPYFGAIEEWPKTPEETIAMGYKRGMRARSEG